MATNYLEPGQLPDGMVLAHTLHGRPDQSVQHAHTTALADGTELIQAPYSGNPYRPPARPAPVSPPETVEPELVEMTPFEDVPEQRAPGRDKRCHAREDTCMGWAIRDSPYCAAHAGVFRREA